MVQPTTNRESSNTNLNDRGAKEEDDSQETFLNLINQSMQESARLVRSSLGRSSYATTREKALQQVAMLQVAKEQFQTGR